MSKKANPVLIGAFVLVAMGIGLAGILILGTGRLFRYTERYVLYFDGDLGGLDVGAPVAFQGFRIGSVSEIRMMCNTDSGEVLIPVYIELEPDRIIFSGSQAGDRNPDFHIREGLRAQLQSQSFVTGKLMIRMLEDPSSPKRLIGDDPTVTEIPTIPTPLDTLAAQLQDLPLGTIVTNVNATMQAVADFVSTGVFEETMQSVRQSAGELESMMKDLQASVGPLATNLMATSSQIYQTLNRAETLVADLSPAVADVGDSIPPLMTSVKENLELFESTQRQFSQTLLELEQAIDQRSPTQYQLTRALDRFSTVAESLEGLVDYLQRHPEALLTGKANVE